MFANVKFFRWICASSLLFFVVSCSSTNRRDRFRDAGDMLTFEVETKSYGVSLRVSSLQLGLAYKDPSGKSIGLRGGDVGEHGSASFTLFLFGADYFQKQKFSDLIQLSEDPYKDQEPLTEKEKADMIQQGIDPSKVKLSDIKLYRRWSRGEFTDEEKKLFEKQKEDEDKNEDDEVDTEKKMKQITDMVSVLKLRNKEYRARAPLGSVIPMQKTKRFYQYLKGTGHAPPSYYTDIQLSLGIYSGIKIGFNIGEFFDLIVGVFGFDPMSDDHAEEKLKKLTEEKQQKNEAPEKYSE